MQNITLPSSEVGMALKVISSRYLCSPLLALLLLNFFFLAGHLVGFISVGKVFAKAFRVFSSIR